MKRVLSKKVFAIASLLLVLVVMLGGHTGMTTVQAAETIPVACTDGVGDAEALIAAVVAANSDPDEDTISLGENCIYTLTASVDGTNGLPIVAADLILEGNGATIKRMSSPLNFRLIGVLPNVSLTAKDVTLQDGLLPAVSGGAILTSPGSSLTLERVSFISNRARDGGAIFAQGPTLIRDSRFVVNRAEDKGGAIYSSGILTITNTTFSNQEAKGGGGAIYAKEVTAVHDSYFGFNQVDTSESNGGAILAEKALTVSGSFFTHNKAHQGGAIMSGDTKITTSTFYFNSSDRRGGAVYAAAAHRGIHDNLFDLNHNNSHGGALYVVSGLDLRRNYFRRNQAEFDGGGLYLESSLIVSLIENNLWENNLSQNDQAFAMSLGVPVGGTFHVRHNTIVHQPGDLPLAGSGIVIANSDGVLENNIITGYEIGIKDNSGTAVSRSNLYFNNVSNEQGLAAPGENILDADPRFVGEGNYRLADGSPAIGSAAATATADDILGTSRPQDQQPDRGAYEFTGETETIFPVACADGAAGMVAAITAANRHFGPDVIELEGADCVIELFEVIGEFGSGEAGLPLVLDSLRLDGRGATLQRNEAAERFRILENVAPVLTIENITIANGYGFDDGGAILSQQFTDLRLNGVTLRENAAVDEGGAAMSHDRMTVENSRIVNNEADYGGGLFADGHLVLHNSVVIGNKAQDLGGGARGHTGDISHTRFENNEAGADGGGIAMSGTTDLQASTFVDNVSEDHGGGLYLSFRAEGSTVTNSIWLNNRSNEGAAIATESIQGNGPLHLLHNTIASTQSSTDVAIYLNSISDNAQSLVANNIIVAYGVGIRRDGASELTTNTNLYFANEVNEQGVTTSENNIITDPRFRDLPNGDVRLLEDSQAIDNALELDLGDAIGDAIAVDYNGITRPQGDGPDIGAHEFMPNVPPMAVSDTYSTVQNTALEIPAPGVLGNDEDANGDSLTASLVDGPANGALSLNADGSFSYTPDAGFTGSDSFRYRTNDGQLESGPATVTINVRPQGSNRPPLAVADNYATTRNTPLQLNPPGVIDNDQDADGDSLQAVLESSPNGFLVLAPNGGLFYTPPLDFVGTDSFTYRLDDGEARSEPATVTITVHPAGTNLPPLAVGNRYETTAGATLRVNAPGVLNNDFDGNSDPLTAVLERTAARGTVNLNANGSFTYTPEPGFSGTDSFTYRASDGRTQSEPATVTIVVRPSGGQMQQTLLPIVITP